MKLKVNGELEKKNEARLLYEADKNRKVEILERVNVLKSMKAESEQKKHDIFNEMKKSLTSKENQAINDCQPLTNNPFFSNISSQNMASIVTNQTQVQVPHIPAASLSSGINSSLTSMPPPRLPGGVNINNTMSPQYSTTTIGVIPNTLPTNNSMDTSPNAQLTQQLPRRPMLGPVTGQQPSFFE